MQNVNVNAANGEVKNVVNLGRDEASKLYGSWCSPKATAATVVSWCDQRIKIYTEWIANCEALKRQNQVQMCQGFSPDELRKMAEALEAAKQQN
jgi:hypothetical protein